MKINRPAIYIAILIWVCLAGCKARKAAVNGPAAGAGAVAVKKNKEKKAFYQQVRESAFDFDFVQARAKTRIELKNKRHDFTLNLRIKKDERIWASVTAILGLEVARALITPDSVIIINRLERTYIKKDIAYLQRTLSPHIDFSALQDILVGNVPDLFLEEESNLWITGGSYLAKGGENRVDYELNINAGYRPEKITVSQPEEAAVFLALFGNFKETQAGGGSAPGSIEISSVNADHFKLQLLYHTFTAGKPVDFPFSVPGRYKDVSNEL